MKFEKLNVPHLTKRSERIAKLLALVVGVVIGSLYASSGRSTTSDFVERSNGNISIVREGSISRQEVNETALFLVPDDTRIADELAQKIKVLCWIHMNGGPDAGKINAIKKTWGAKCTGFVTITTNGPNATDTFNIPKSRNQNSNIENAYRFIYNKYGDKYHWFLKTSGSNYVVMENLRYKLYSYNPSTAFGVGHAKDLQNKLTYLSDKAGYALSKEALKKLMDAFDKGPNCGTNIQVKNDELLMGLCMKMADVKIAESTDQDGRVLFFDKFLDDFLLPDPNVKFPYPWYQEYKVDHNLDAASNYSIAFCDVGWQQMHVMEFLIYQLRPYGLETETPQLPENNNY